MAGRQQNNFKLPAFIYALLEEYLHTMNARGVHLQHNEVAAAALLGFLDSPEQHQIDLIRRIRSHDLENLQTSESAEEATQVVRRALKKTGSPDRSPTDGRTRP